MAELRWVGAASVLVLLCGCAASREPGASLPAIPLESRPLLAVRAEASTTLAPDVARIAFEVDAVAKTSEEAVRDAARRTQALVKALEAMTPRDQISTGEVIVAEAYSEAPTPRPGDFVAAVVGHWARLHVRVKDVRPQDATAIFRSGLASGATSGVVTLSRKACRDTLKTLRIEALENALQRARLVASNAGAQLGALYQLKENAVECADLSEEVLEASVALDESGEGISPIVTVPELGAVAARTVLHPRVEVLLVYQLTSDTTVPSGEAPGEVHLGLTRTFHAESREVVGTVTIRARAAAADPSSALQRAVSTMNTVTQALRAAGLTDEELFGSDAQVDTRTVFASRAGHLARVPHDYVGESRITIATRRFDELGRWLRLAAQSGATGLDGPTYELAEPERVLDRALAAAAAQAKTDAGVLARAAGQQPRAPTHIRASCGWLSETDPLRRFVEDLGSYGGFGSRSVRVATAEDELQPDGAFPDVAILPPARHAPGEIAIGFALAERSEAP